MWDQSIQVINQSKIFVTTKKWKSNYRNA